MKSFKFNHVVISLLTVIFVCGLTNKSHSSALEFNVTGASNETTTDGIQFDADMNYFVPNDLFKITVTNTSNTDGDLLVSIHLRGDDNNTLEDREWIERWFIYSSINPFSATTLSSNSIPQVLTILPEGDEITLLNFYVDESVALKYPVVFTGYLYDDANNLIGFDSETIFFKPF